MTVIPSIHRPVACRRTAFATALPVSIVALAVATLTFAGGAHAQSGTGLKLGEESPEPTLNLGAGPAADTAPADAPSRGTGTTPGGSGPAAAPADAVRTTHGDWEVACAPEGVEGGCAMAQIGEDDTGTPVLEIVIRKLAEPLEVNEETAVAVLDVITPLGVVLTEGLGMQIDGGRLESAAFQICTEQGCLVREPIGDDLIARLKKGRVAKVSVFAANQGEVVSDISLSGFTKAFEATR